MTFSISSNVVIAITLWLMLALSCMSESHDFDSRNGYEKFGHGSPKNRGGKNRGPLKSHGGKNHGPKKPPSSPPTAPSSPPPRPFGLKVGFYKGLCPNNVDIEATIINKVREHFAKDSSIIAALLRMQFHDCFVHGCDASILINGTSSEKMAGPNLSVRGYELIDALKSIAEAQCPEMVSCADIIAIATKAVIKLVSIILRISLLAFGEKGA
ncbi:hypothetical protein RND81_02G204200 [Saponaria officinalis]|uniref:peroxidase n=1 Tax=Saponaria officinalis TaxID=3572 RepID=A0AAW1MP26_SAPOF